MGSYDPEKVTAYEIGSKNRFFNNKLQINLAAFFYDYQNHQVPVEISEYANVPNYQTEGSPARMVGFEAEILWQASRNDRFALSVDYTHAYYVNQPADFLLGVTNKDFAGVVPWQIAPAYYHSFRLGHNRSLVLGGEAIYNSAYYVTNIADNPAIGLDQLALAPYARNGDTVRVNLSLTFNFREHASLTAYVRNIADTRYKTTVLFNDMVPNDTQAYLSDPRTFGVVLNFGF